MSNPEQSEEYSLSEAMAAFETGSQQFEAALTGYLHGQTQKEQLYFLRNNHIAASQILIGTYLETADTINSETLWNVMKFPVGAHNLAFCRAAESVGIPPVEWKFRHHDEVKKQAPGIAELCNITGMDFSDEIGLLLGRYIMEDLQALTNLHTERLPLGRLKSASRETVLFANSMLAALTHRTARRRRK